MSIKMSKVLHRYWPSENSHRDIMFYDMLICKLLRGYERYNYTTHASWKDRDRGDVNSYDILTEKLTKKWQYEIEFEEIPV